LIADKLDKKSKLRLLFEENNSFVCVPFYADNYQSLFYIIDNFFKKNKIKVSQEIINILINRANGNRRILNNEIKKIESFIINKKQIKQEDILLFGREDSGLPDSIIDKSDFLISIFMPNLQTENNDQKGVRSLNLSVACGIAIYEAHKLINFQNGN